MEWILPENKNRNPEADCNINQSSELKEDSIISINNLCKSFGKQEVLKGINLELNKGCITGVMGPNGSGKTTMLKAILGLVQPNSGDIYVKGININNNCEYRKYIGYMPQTPRYPDNLKVKELIAMLKDVKGNQCDYDEELIEQLNMKEIFDKTIGTLSSGTKQRVSSAVAFLFNQDIIILDEPTAGLDPVSTETVKNKILKEKQNGKLVIITSHIISEVETLADRLVFLLEGNIYVDSSIGSLKKRTGEENLNRAIAVLMQGGK